MRLPGECAQVPPRHRLCLPDAQWRHTRALAGACGPAITLLSSILSGVLLNSIVIWLGRPAGLHQYRPVEPRAHTARARKTDQRARGNRPASGRKTDQRARGQTSERAENRPANVRKTDQRTCGTQTSERAENRPASAENRPARARNTDQRARGNRPANARKTDQRARGKQTSKRAETVHARKIDQRACGKQASERAESRPANVRNTD